MNKIELFLEIAKIARPIYAQDLVIDSLDTPLSETELDSLDFLMIGIYYADIYGIQEEVAKEMQPETIQGYYDFCEIHKTKEPASIEEALASIK